MRCYEGTILSVNEKNQVFHYLVEDQGRILYVGDELPEEYRKVKVILISPWNRSLPKD